MSKRSSRFSTSSLVSLAPMAAALGAMLSITLGASLAKSLFPLIGPAGTTVLRLGIAAVMLAVAFRIWRIRPDRRQWRAVPLRHLRRPPLPDRPDSGRIESCRERPDRRSAAQGSGPIGPGSNA